MEANNVAQQENKHTHPQPGSDVTVTVNNQPKTVHRGHYIVSEFKKIVGVDATMVLDEVVNHELKELDDTADLVIKGGEIFISHVRRGGSSWHGRA
jgi:hypothetical protein